MESETSGIKADQTLSDGALGTPKVLTPEAQRALAEAEERRRARSPGLPAPVEIGGRAGPDPARFGDWETGGIVSDF